MFVISYVASTTPVFLVFFACRPFLSFVILGSHLALLRFVCLFSYVHSSCCCCCFFLFLFWLLMLFFYTHARTLLLLQQLFAIFLEPVVLLVLDVSLHSLPRLSSPILCMLSTTQRSHTTPHLKHTQAAAHDGVACNTVRLTFNRKSMPNAHTSLLSRTLCIYTSFLLCTLRYIYVYIYEKINKKNNHNTALRIISSPVVCRKKLCLLLQCKV